VQEGRSRSALVLKLRHCKREDKTTGTHYGVSLLNELVAEDQRLEGHDLVGQDRLDSNSVPNRDGSLVVPSVDDTF